MYSIKKILTIVLLIVIGLLLYPHMNPEDITAFIKQNQITAPLIFIIICTIRPVFFFLPPMGLTIVAGILFGAAWGTLYVSIGGAFSTIVGYFFARWLGRDAIKRITQFDKRLKQMDEWSQRYGKNAVLTMRLFNVPWDIVSYWAALTGIKFKSFYIASMIPLLPISFLYTYFGSKVFQPASLGFIISLLIMIILGATPFILWKLKKRVYG